MTEWTVETVAAPRMSWVIVDGEPLAVLQRTAPVVARSVVHETVNVPSLTLVTRMPRVRNPVTGVADAVPVADAVSEAVAVAVDEGGGVGVAVPGKVDVADAVAVTDGPGVTVASSTMIVPVMPADAEEV